MKKLSILFAIIIAFFSCSKSDNYEAKTDYKFPFVIESEQMQEIISNEPTTFKIKPKADKEGDVTYTVSVEASSNKVDVTYNDQLLKFGNTYNYNKDSFKINFSEAGQYEIVFKIENNYGYGIRHKEVFNVGIADFQVNITEPEIILPLSDNTFKLNLNSKDSYKFSVDANNSNVDFFYNKIKLQRNTPTDYNTSDINIKFKDVGLYSITFNITNKSGNQRKITIPVEIKQIDFSINTEIPAFMNFVASNMLLDIKEVNSTYKPTYQFKVSANTNKVVFLYNNQNLKVDELTDFSTKELNITFKESGQFNLSFTFVNQFGLSKTINRTVTVGNDMSFKVHDVTTKQGTKAKVPVEILSNNSNSNETFEIELIADREFFINDEKVIPFKKYVVTKNFYVSTYSEKIEKVKFSLKINRSSNEHNVFENTGYVSFIQNVLDVKAYFRNINSYPDTNAANGVYFLSVNNGTNDNNQIDTTTPFEVINSTPNVYRYETATLNNINYNNSIPFSSIKVYEKNDVKFHGIQNLAQGNYTVKVKVKDKYGNYIVKDIVITRR